MHTSLLQIALCAISSVGSGRLKQAIGHVTGHALSLHVVQMPQAFFIRLRPSIKKGKGTRNHNVEDAALRVAELPMLAFERL